MTFDQAWRALADEDASRKAPLDLEARVRAAVARRTEREPRRDVFAREALAVAASIGVALVWSVFTSAPDAPASTIVAKPIASRALATFAVTASRERPGLVSAGRQTATVPTAPRADLPSAMLRLSPDPVAALETVQLVRLRLPREALQAFGLVLLEPETTGIVDVDVLVGEDGLPRDIRKVRVEPQ
jgi:hypothetical protein